MGAIMKMSHPDSAGTRAAAPAGRRAFLQAALTGSAAAAALPHLAGCATPPPTCGLRGGVLREPVRELPLHDDADADRVRITLGEGVRRWVALEPDESLASHARESLGVAAAPIEVRHCTSGQLSAAETFDAILYIDVLEHIEDDAGEIARTFHHLAPGGHLIVLAPAHQVLYSAFDAAIGHFRRYSRGMLEGIAPPGATLVLARYLDSAGLLASGANRLLLRQNTPTPQQIRTWDRVLVPVSRVLDRLLGFRAGKSILAIWRKPA